jgi:hypothetical protein
MCRRDDVAMMSFKEHRTTKIPIRKKMEGREITLVTFRLTPLCT